MTTETDCPSHIEARERLTTRAEDLEYRWRTRGLDTSITDDWRVLAADLRTLLDTPTQGRDRYATEEEICRIVREVYDAGSKGAERGATLVKAELDLLALHGIDGLNGDADAPKPQPRGWPTREEVAHAVKDVLRQYSVAGADLRKVTDRKVIGNAIAERVQKTFPPCETAGGEVERADPGAGETADLIATAQKMARRMGTEFVVDPDKVARYGTGPGVTTPSPASTSSGEPHPEDTCEDCGRDNPVWFAPSPLWNLVMGGPEAQGDPGGIVCPVCFVQRAEAADVRPTAWVVTPEGEPAPGAPEGWPEIAHPHRPPSAFTERAYLRRQIERVGEETAVVGTLCTTAMASDSRGSLSGYLWAIAEWAQGQIAKTSDAALKDNGHD